MSESRIGFKKLLIKMLKTCLSNFSRISFLVGRIFPFMIFDTVNRIYNNFYAGMCSKKFAVCGANFILMRPAFIFGGRNITIGENFNACSRLRIETFELHNGIKFSPIITIGDNVSINHNCHIGCIDSISILDNVLIASDVFICDHFHGELTLESLTIPPSERKLSKQGSVIIEKNVWIGEKVTILPGVTIGEGSVIGSGSVVTKSCPPYSIIAGVPARIIHRVEQ